MGRTRHVHTRFKQGIGPRAERKPAAKCPACGKDSYTSKRLAKQSARRLFPGDTMRFYACPGTPYWHMTSQDADRAAETRARMAGDDLRTADQPRT